VVNAKQTTDQKGATEMKITTIGFDVAKTVFQIHGVDGCGRVAVRKRLKRGQVLTYFSNLTPCLVGMEACGSAHYWARQLMGLGHTVKLIAPQFVKPYVKSNKNDVADAEAICEAVLRPNMRFVPVKSPEQQGILALHRARQGFVKARTAQANQIRGLLAEFGIVIPQGIHNMAKRLPAILEDGENGLSDSFRALLHRLGEHLRILGCQVDELEAQIQNWHRGNAASRRLAQIPGIGPITASALVASIGDARNFQSGRQLAAWLGLVPKQHSSGGKSVLLRILLIHGARAVVREAGNKPGYAHGWLGRLIDRRHKNVATVALANKNARIVWALLAHDRTYQADYQISGTAA
jgi:transposase